MIWFEAPLSLLYRDLGALEVLSIHSFIHTDEIWLYILLEQIFLIIYRVGVKSSCGIWAIVQHRGVMIYTLKMTLLSNEY